MRSLTGVVLLAVSAGTLAAADWTDRAEYDLVLAIRSEAAIPKKLELLDAWKAKYPASPLRQERREFYLAAYASLGDTTHMVDVVKEMLTDRSDHPVGSYWCSVLMPGGGGVSPEVSGLCEKALAAQKDQPKDAALLARRALGWIQWQRGDLLKAEAEFTAYLREDPGNPEIATWLGTVLALQKQPEKAVASLWQLARGGPKAAAMLETVYASFHGGPDGIEELRAAAAQTPEPPPGFTIQSAAEAAGRQKDRVAQPDAVWTELRKQLEATDGAEYFAATLSGKPLPKMKGTLARFTAPGKVEELVIAMEKPAGEDVIVKLSEPLPADPAPGQPLEFEGIAESFTAVPFRLVVRADPAKITPAK